MTDAKLPDTNDIRLVTPPGVLSFPALLKPEENRFKKKMEYSTTLLIDKTEVAEDPGSKALWANIWQTLYAHAVHNLGTQAVNRDGDKVSPAFDHKGIVDGDDTDRAEQAGRYVLRAKAPEEMPPPILGLDNKPLTAEDSHLIFPGQRASMLIGIYFYSGEGYASGVSLNLYGVKILGGGEPLLSGGSAMTSDDVANAFDTENLLPAPEKAEPAKLAAPDPSGEEFNDDIPF